MPGLGRTTAVATPTPASSGMPPIPSLDSYSSATNAENGKPKLDPSDPRVRKLVYSMYRGMLTTFNGEANDIISKKDPAEVTQDLGVGPILQSIIIKQRSSQGGGGDPSAVDSPAIEGEAEDSGTLNGAVAMPPPPPPPMMPGAGIPAVRLSSEIGPRDKGPPAAIASAMMKDKKPFTYTPGGIDLSEIRSPRMAKRIQMNAMAEGVTNTPTPSSSNQERPPCHLPPAALAAMQPQMAIPVFPQGGLSAVRLNRMHKAPNSAGPPPPPPPPPMPTVVAPPPMQPIVVSPAMPTIASPPMRNQVSSPMPTIASPPMRNQVSSPPAPSPVMATPTPPPPALGHTTPTPPMSPLSPPPPSPPARTPPPPPERAATPKSPALYSESLSTNSRPESQLSNHDERKSPLGRKSPNIEMATGVGTGCIYIPPIQSPPPPPPPPAFSPSPYAPPSSRPAGQTKAQQVSQSIGSLYIPPIGPTETKMETPSTGGSGSASNGSAVTRPPQSAQAMTSTPLTAAMSSTPQLNRAPVPWMNSYNRMQNQQAESPPYVHPGYFMPPWGPLPPGQARAIPIMMQDQSDGGHRGGTDSRQPTSPPSPSGSRTPSQAATHLGRLIPIQIEREDAMRQKGAKIIPIQIEGRPPRGHTPSTPSLPGPARRTAGPQMCSPIGMYSNQNAQDAYQRQADAAAGIDRMTMRCPSPRTEPAQSRALHVIQQAAENELHRYELEQQPGTWEMAVDGRPFMNMFKPQVQVDEGTFLHQTAEPRFRGAHIPSKAFKALQTALPASPGAQDQLPPSLPAAQPGQVHHIPIRQVSQSPTPQSQGSEIQLSSQANVPPSEQKIQEPKKYMGSNIPSRSFKILQAMTADDGQSETATEQNLSADSYDDSLPTCLSTDNVPLSPCSSSSSYPLSLSFSSSEGGGSSTFDPYNCTQNPWPDIMDQGWDPYSYMWYYWWYYASCYWAGYDMTGYEYPPGWDPNYPYCPPELFSDYSAFSEYMTASAAQTDDSCAENGLEESYYSQDNNNDTGRLPPSNSKEAQASLPKIVIEEGDGGGGGGEGNYGRNRTNIVDSIKYSNNSNHDDGSSTSKAPRRLTECNEKPGNPIPYKANDCDSPAERSTWKVGLEKNSAECRQLENGNDNDDDEKETRREGGREDDDSSSSSSSEDEYESCCEDEQKVIERETGPCNKPFVSQNPHHFSAPAQDTTEPEKQQQQPSQRKFEFHGNYNSELNANDQSAHHHHHHHQHREHPGKDEDNGVMEEEEDEDEKTDPGADDDNDDDDDYGGRPAIIEEPETPSSADDSDTVALISGEELECQRAGKSSVYSNGGLSIEEYHSEESSAESVVGDYGPKKNRLSTIEEMTESRASSSMLSSRTNLSADLDCVNTTSNNNLRVSSGRQNEKDQAMMMTGGECEDSDESSEDEMSSVSVIENKSDATRGTESKREDETSSSEDSSDDDDEDAAGADTAVTVRLPLKLCFTKTKSYKDITTVMVGDSEIEKIVERDTNNGCDDSGSKKVNEALQLNTDHHHQQHLARGDDEQEDTIFSLATSVETDDEPVVSFTLSLSRQSSREEEKVKSPTSEGQSETKENNRGGGGGESADIDFWATITGEESTSTQSVETTTVEVECEPESKGDEEKEEDEDDKSCEADVDFWGVIARDRSTTHIRRIQSENEDADEINRNRSSREHQDEENWDPYESIDYKWEKDFNFWEKSSRTIETRRFSNFEITEDYESDSGLKPSMRREKAKRYTHHKRHSVPGPGWDRSSLPPRPTSNKQSTPKTTTSSNNEQDIKGKEHEQLMRKKNETTSRSETISSEKQTTDQDDTDAASWWSYWDEVSADREGKSENNEDHANITLEKVEPGVSTLTTTTAAKRAEKHKEEDSADTISVEIKLSESERHCTGESCPEDDYQSFAPIQTSRTEESRGSSGGFSSLDRKDDVEVKDRKSLNHSCQSDATTVTTDNEDYSSSPEIKSSLRFPNGANQEAEKLIQGSSCISDENSDESSSRSSGTTIGRHDKSEIKKQTLTPIPPATGRGEAVEVAAAAPDVQPDSESHLKSLDESTQPVDTSIQIPISIERTVEIQHDVGERIKLNGKQQQHQHQLQQHEEHHHHHHHLATATSAISTTSSCTCLMGDRIARAENLLWRIERFLHESLSLGSEDDSGVMTDLSRQISDVDTDVDNDLNETEFLLTAAAAAKERRGLTHKELAQQQPHQHQHQHIESCNFAETISSTDTPNRPPSTSPVNNNSTTSPVTPSAAQVKKPRPKSDIISESSLSKMEAEMAEESVGVKMRSPSERRALRYQRAKTHSRLFQLLQDECGRDEEQDEFDYDSDVGTPTMCTVTTDVLTNCQINVDSTTTTVVDGIHADAGSSAATTRSHSSSGHDGVDDECNNGASPGMNDAQARRSRLLPLPIKNLLASSLSLDSNSSPSGSSGVLSPTSPVNRDQLLADIINEFHLRNQATTLKAQSQRRISSSFPSKVFKLLQHEFGEEFYQTFDCCNGSSGGVGEDSLISPCVSTNLCVNDSTTSNLIAAGTAVVHECTIHKSDSMKEFEEATNRILTNFMLKNKQQQKLAASACQPFSESPSSTATMSSQLLQDDSKKTSADFLEVPMRKKKGSHLARDPRSPKKY